MSLGVYDGIILAPGQEGFIAVRGDAHIAGHKWTRRLVAFVCRGVEYKIDGCEDCLSIRVMIQ